ncbi:DUF6455 family protein [Aestuariivita sp.]|jgi:hypothetical protein|uniref:DUF6455 family protein n=1 Tax=Aestuariivita sp. TaxID=1872407 RepID=UPI00216EC70F|nr:DUF6455 family protein [Aestuariivita sp.]MCE8007518.1 hypothetical protein [Aestuariivita sp.]
MLHHLGLEPTPEDATQVLDELRETFLACVRCPTPGRCRCWCEAGRPGTPDFCGGKQAFRNLEIACLAQHLDRH